MFQVKSNRVAEKLGLLLIVALTIPLSGCFKVPANRIDIQSPRGKYKVATPKDVEIKKFEATVDTNGSMTISFDSWKSNNDPQVIDKVSAGRVAEIKAVGDVGKQMLEKGIDLGKKAIVP